MLYGNIYRVVDTSQDADIRRVPPIARYEKRVDPDGQNLITVLHTLYSEDRQFKKDIDAAMQAAFGDDFEGLVFPPAADHRVQMRIRWKPLKNSQTIGGISDGTLRFLFLMTVLAAPDPAPLIAIDEPETGLHPSMFSIIAEYAAQAAKKTQVVFTTHSPQFLDACGPFLPTVTVTGWKNGETTLKNLDGDLLTKWLDDYSLGKMFESGDLEALA
ncbi:AAA family ATPase [Desulfovibrio sulfodismutans]|uniref:AAA family ATPase n=1 Tax=Desulfolutivibrio sulfodismutans TaxID=63561 RepID=A0A7K3NIS3_9BACT|nr:AAA family ATPase [Desulfolutivibrio sulfodismutans]NDY55723.1 AAA family ATPase [Desulfolutivibrio sulfodismutans]QLA13743.1 AAA family ATPase [Desulfolutivibrio sulfodismutans DSM 3696]